MPGGTQLTPQCNAVLLHTYRRQRVLTSLVYFSGYIYLQYVYIHIFFFITLNLSTSRDHEVAAVVRRMLPASSIAARVVSAAMDKNKN